MTGRLAHLYLSKRGISMKQTYEAPVLRNLGTLAELTQYYNKIGPNSDVHSASDGIQGSIVLVLP
jgi:hypothetical protein